MYDFNNLLERAAFHLWFTRVSDDVFDVFEVDSGKRIGWYHSKSGLYHPDESTKSEEGSSVERLIDLKEVKEQFEQFKASRPEYCLGLPWEEVSSDPRVAYETLLCAVTLCRAFRKGQNVDKAVSAAHRCLEWLDTTDFYTAPASTQYHESYPGGLLHHSLKVYNMIIQLSKSIKAFSAISLDEIGLVALVHDWCKIGLYESYMRNVKDEKGNWVQQPSYRHKSEIVPLGHGVTSMFFASSFFKLTDDEACALRWHMGAWRVTPSEQNDLQEANERYPLVHLLQFADQLSIVKYI